MNLFTLNRGKMKWDQNFWAQEGFRRYIHIRLQIDFEEVLNVDYMNMNSVSTSVRPLSTKHPSQNGMCFFYHLRITYICFSAGMFFFTANIPDKE